MLQLQDALAQGSETQIGGHQLGQRRRLDTLVGILVGQDLAGAVIEEQPGATGDDRCRYPGLSMDDGRCRERQDQQ